MKITAILIMLVWILLIVISELRNHNTWRKRTYRDHQKLLDQFAIALRDDMRTSEKKLVLSLEELQDKMKTNHDINAVKLDAIHNTITRVDRQTMHIPGALDNITDHLGAISNKAQMNQNKLQDSLLAMAKTLDTVTPIAREWGIAQTDNLIKKGESHRTLRRRLNECEKHFQELSKRIEEQSKTIEEQDKQLHLVKTTRDDIIEEFRHEIKLTRAWIADKGLPSHKLDSHLKSALHGSIPSVAYQIKDDEKKLGNLIKKQPTNTRFA